MPEVDVTLDEEIKTKTKKPSFYKVIFHNDDSTPMDWVVKILMAVFRHDGENAWNLTQEVHNQGSAVVGVYTYEIAAEKVRETITASRSYGYPLEVSLEADDNDEDE